MLDDVDKLATTDAVTPQEPSVVGADGGAVRGAKEETSKTGDTASANNARQQDADDDPTQEGFSPRFFEQTSTFRSPKRAALAALQPSEREGLEQQLSEALAILEEQSCVLICGPAYTLELARVVAYEWAENEPAVCSIPSDEGGLYQVNQVLDALMGCEPQTIVQIEVRLPIQAHFLAGLCADGAFLKLLQHLKGCGSILVVAIEHTRHLPDPVITSQRQAGRVLEVPWESVLRMRLEKAIGLRLEAPELDPLWANISSHLSRDPASVGYVATKLTRAPFPTEEGKAGVDQFRKLIDEVCYREPAETAVTRLMEEGWQRGLRRMMLSLFTVLVGSGQTAEYGTVRRLGMRLMQHQRIRTPVQKKQICERKDSNEPFVLRETSVFEERDAADEWIGRLDETLRECGFSIDSREDREPVITCHMRAGWNAAALANDIWARYRGSVLSIIEAVIARKHLYPEDLDEELSAMDAAPVLVAASRLAHRDFPRDWMLRRVLDDAAEVANERIEKSEKEHVDLRPIALGIAHYLKREVESAGSESTEKLAGLLTDTVKSVLYRKELLQARLLVVTLGWMTVGTWIDAEKYLLDLLAGTDTFGEHNEELRNDIFFSLRRSMRKSFVSRVRILRNVASRTDPSPEAAFTRDMLLAHLWHDGLRRDFRRPLASLEECFAGQLSGATENLEELLRLFWGYDHALVLFRMGRSINLTLDTARMLLSNTEAGTPWSTLSRPNLEAQLQAIIEADYGQRIEKGVEQAQEAFDKELQAFEKELAKNNSVSDMRGLYARVRESHANMSLAQAHCRPFEQYRCIAMAVWAERIAGASSEADPPVGHAAADTLARCLRGILSSEQSRQTISAWRDASTWLGELRRKLTPQTSATYEVRKEYERTRDCLRLSQDRIRYLSDQLQNAADTQQSAGNLVP